MFDDTLRFLDRLKRGVRVPISLPLDEEGYFDRKCPGDSCGTVFKVLFEDWKNLVPDERVYCPLCRQESPSDDWNTPEQRKHIEAAAHRYLGRELSATMRRDAQQFNARQPSGGFIKMSMSVKPGSLPALVPSRVVELMQQRFTCEGCGCRYASIGASFFCPACGHNSAQTAFSTTIATVRKLVESLDILAEAMQAAQGKDAAEDTIRQILEDSLGRLTGAFQRLTEVLFNKLPQATTIAQRRNVFQSLQQSSDLWESAGLQRYEAVLTPTEWQSLIRLVQQRHLIAHCNGIVDQDYLTRSGDSRYSIGQRLIVTASAVSELATLVEKLGTAKITEVADALK